ncbi:MAG: hypothetical protein IKE94_15580 [Aeriscardovia sp.]|nr:hypothetical protein [Aeriscardovia sp.]
MPRKKKEVCGHPDIEEYLQSIEKDKPRAGADLHKFAAMVRNAFAKGDTYVDIEQWERYKALGEAMFSAYGGLMPWEKCLGCLVLSTYRKSDHRPRWKHSLIMIGRGAGKDGFIAWSGLCFISKNNRVAKYDVDICANNEEQGLRPVKDAVEFLNNPRFRDANKASFYWTSERVKGLQNGGLMRGHTNNPKGKDGLRSGVIILNEIHQYEDKANINVFTTGLGKKACPRSIYITTNGNVREGVLDEELGFAQDILNGESTDDSTLPFLCRLDSKEEVHDETNWVKANPSLPYMPDLMQEIRDEYKKWKIDRASLPDFMSKRMNVPDLANDRAVTEYAHIKATNRPMLTQEELRGSSAMIGIDTSKTTDFESVSAIIKKNGEIYVLNHTWVCLKSKDLPRIKIKEEFPKWIDMGIMTLVDDVEISPEYIKAYVSWLKTFLNIQKVCIDDFRYALFSKELEEIGFSYNAGNLKKVRPSDIAKIVPVIDSYFLNDKLVWGDNPMLRWATNNTKVIQWHPRSTGYAELGNQLYAKIEPKSRKTDPFMSFVHAMVLEPELQEARRYNRTLFRARTY